jgi:hypothetical protein
MGICTWEYDDGSDSDGVDGRAVCCDEGHVMSFYGELDTTHCAQATHKT